MPHSEQKEIEKDLGIISTQIVTYTSTVDDAVEDQKAAEARLRRKIDLHIIPPVAFIYLFCFIDRSNIGNARLAGLERDLELIGYDFNIILTSFYIAYVVFEMPSVLCCKLIGPGRWLPLCTIVFGILTISFAFARSFASAFAVRFLLGAAEAGLLPGIAFYLSRWYRKDELAFRISLYVIMAPMAGAFGGLLASGILSIKSIGSLREWEMIFVVEGIITVGVGILAFIFMTKSLETASWLTEQERTLATERLQSEMTNKTQDQRNFKRRAYFSAIFTTSTLLCALNFFFGNISVQGIAFFTPTIVSSLCAYFVPGRTVVRLQLYTVPPYIFGAIVVVLFPYLSMRYRIRWPFVAACGCLMITGYSMFLGSNSTGARYAASFLGAAGAFGTGPLLPAWASANVETDTERNGAIAFVVFAGNLGGLVATWSYLPNSAPNFVPGNALNLAASGCILVLALALPVLLRMENQRREDGKRDHLLVNVSEEQRNSLGHRHPSHRYR